MRILSIDTSCDETSAAVTEDLKVISNAIWSQAAAHAAFGGVMPSLAKRLHEERIDWVIRKALGKYDLAKDIDAIAVTIGPGLSIALGVGVDKAKELAGKFNKPLIPVNHIEAHLLSPFAQPKTANKKTEIIFPAYGLCVSGGNTIFVLIKNIGEYEILAQTADDALGEALDKGARMIGLGYPGGAILEKMAKKGNGKKFNLPIPLIGQENRMIFSYSGLKTSFYRLIEKHKKLDTGFPNKQDVYDLASAFQDTSFKHIERVMSYYMRKKKLKTPKHLLLGGGVTGNIELRKRLRSLGGRFGNTLHIPYAKKLCGDNAGMIGVAAFLKISAAKVNSIDPHNSDSLDRNPRLKLV
jgi:N6-L-threonylcarbamoyladenine synthase